MVSERCDYVFYALLLLCVPGKAGDGDGDRWPDIQFGRGGLAVVGKQ